jgi:hypothetical protein
MALIFGIVVAGLGGVPAGALSWPMNLMKRFQFEQCWFTGMVFGLLFVPWAVALFFVQPPSMQIGAVLGGLS